MSQLHLTSRQRHRLRRQLSAAEDVRLFRRTLAVLEFDYGFDTGFYGQRLWEGHLKGDGPSAAFLWVSSTVIPPSDWLIRMCGPTLSWSLWGQRFSCPRGPWHSMFHDLADTRVHT
jgi:hypothetical protein